MEADVRSVAYATEWGPGRIRFSDDDVVAIDLPRGGIAPRAGIDLPDPVVNLRSALEAFFAGRGPLPDGSGFAERAGTAFRRAVYRVVCAIPSGETLTYREVAARAGRPIAARAVGPAMAQNRFAPVIPCHRVVGSDRALRGYGGGVEMKRVLLEREGAWT